MKVPIKIHYFKKDQRVEFNCPFCNQLQGWKGSVRVDDERVHPDPGAAFRNHTLGNNDGSAICLVKPSVFEVDEYVPVAKVEP